MATVASTGLDALRPYRERIDVALERFFADIPGVADLDVSAHSKQALALLKAYSLRPGKRIRGSLASLSYDAATQGESYGNIGLRLGVVLELVQNYLLIVDDVMDKSRLRRGEPALHVLYEPAAKGHGGAHEANMLAVNVGLLTQHFANLLLAQLEVPAEARVQAFAILHRNISATGFGQLDDLYQQPGREVSELDIIRKYRLKSSYYTFVNPLQLGFALGGRGTAETLAACRAFGEPAGIAFQLHDDYLGIFGDAKRLGKPTLDDIREGKFTLLIQYALAHAVQADKQLLLSILGNSRATSADLATVERILTATGAKTYNHQQERHYALAAKRQLAKQPIGNVSFQKLLADVVDYAIERRQ